MGMPRPSIVGRSRVTDLYGEVWLTPKETPYHQVSNYGRVKTILNEPVFGEFDEHGEVYLYLVGSSYQYYVWVGYIWELMLSAFYHRPPANVFPIYLDDRPQVCSLDNLSWGYYDGDEPKVYYDNRENGYGYFRLTKTRTWRVRCNETGEIFPSASAAAKAFGVSRGNISDCFTGRRKSVKGYTFSSV